MRKQLDHANDGLKQRTALPPKVEAALRQIVGSVYFGLGEYAMAIDLLERALELERQHLGPDHEETLRTMHILGETYWWSGDDERMLKLAQEGLELSRKALGETNSMTLHFLADEAAARVCGETGTTEETERLLTNALRVTSSSLGETSEMAFRLQMLLAHHQQLARPVRQGGVGACSGPRQETVRAPGYASAHAVRPGGSWPGLTRRTQANSLRPRLCIVSCLRTASSF